MRMPSARSILCLAAAGLAAGCAGSDSSRPDVPDIDQSFLRGISSYDQNRDGTVTCDEWRAAAAGEFARVNKSGSGFLTDEEFRNLGTSDRTFITVGFKYYDANGDGKIDKKEFVERPNPAFAYADSDKDCRLTAPEQITARNLSAPPASSVAKPSTASGGPATAGNPPGPGGPSRGGY